MRVIYADNNATTAVAPEVAAAMEPFLGELYFNPSSMYEAARPVARAIEKARASAATLLGGVEPNQILFTCGATESNNAAIFGAARANRARKHIITTTVEHPAVLEVCREMQRDGFEVDFLPVDRSGRLAVADFVRALRPDTLLVSIMHANNETGVIFPVHELARITKETDASIVFHTDATQAVGKIPLDLTGEFRHIDMLSLSGHKMHAPKGIGALFVRRGTAWRPYLIGGHQEGGRRAGTYNAASIIGLGAACDLASQHGDVPARIAALRDRLEAELVERVPRLEINGRDSPRLPNTLNVACHFVEGEGILYQLSDMGICASSGSACTSGSLDPSHVLKAMNLPFTAIHGSVRFSFSRYTTDADIDTISEVFPRVIENLRKMSPYWDVAANQPR